MSRESDLYDAHQRARWMRHDAHVDVGDLGGLSEFDGLFNIAPGDAGLDDAQPRDVIGVTEVSLI